MYIFVTVMEETLSWREDPEIVEAMDRLFLKAAPELNIIMAKLDDAQSVKERAHGNMGMAIGFLVSLWCVHYERHRRTGTNPIQSFDHAMMQLAGHQMMQQVIARSAQVVVDRAVGAEQE